MEQHASGLSRVVVATDRSASADKAVHWAAEFAARQGSELVVVQVLAPRAGESDLARLSREQSELALADLARLIAGGAARGVVVESEDVAQAILDVVEAERAETVVVGNVGMSGRRQFLLGNVPNRVSHNARCNVIILNTSVDGAGANGAVVHAVAPAEPGRVGDGRLLRRAFRIGTVLARAGVEEWQERRGRGSDEVSRATARRAREVLNDLGPTFAKLGQILSTRPDLLPEEFIEELSHLQERVTPLSEVEVVSVIEEELRVPWEDVFTELEFEPMAAGTIAQVHRARLENGERVVVKVQRPTAEQEIAQDLGLLEMFAARVGERPAFKRAFDVNGIVGFLSESLRRELDFKQEAANIERMREVLAGFERLGVPVVHHELSTARLLVMEEVEGVPLRDAPDVPERREAARQLLESYYRQVLTEGFFHADPHAGNLKWWRDSVYFLDLGMIGQVDPEARHLMTMLMLAVWQEDAPFLSDVVLALAGGAEAAQDIDLDGFRSDLGEVVARYRKLPLREIQLGPMLQEVTEISMHHGVRLPASLALTAKAFAQMQLAVAELDPDLEPFAVAGSFMVKDTLKQMVSGLSPQNVVYETRKAGSRFMRILDAIESVAGSKPGPRLQVHFKGTERLEFQIEQASTRLSLALGFSAAIVGAAMTANSPLISRWVPTVLGGAGSALGVGLAVNLLRRRKP
ncbi:MAG: AarF/UbiB family protein [Dehalococcoidia bacterium]